MTDDLIATLRDQLDEFETRRADLPDRLRVDTSGMVPRGTAVQVPYEHDGSVNLARRLDDGGPTEIVMNGEDWDELVASMTVDREAVKHPNFAASVFGVPVIDERRKPSNKQTGGES